MKIIALIITLFCISVSSALGFTCPKMWVVDFGISTDTTNPIFVYLQNNSGAECDLLPAEGVQLFISRFDTTLLMAVTDPEYAISVTATGDGLLPGAHIESVEIYRDSPEPVL